MFGVGVVVFIGVCVIRKVYSVCRFLLVMRLKCW